MLNFYKIPDNIIKPEWPEKINLKKVGDLNLRNFQDLKKKTLISESRNYWEDNRWSNLASVKLYHLMLKNYPKLEDGTLKIICVNKFFNIVKEATKDTVGLIAYCD